jgi:hypothetical protein
VEIKKLENNNFRVLVEDGEYLRILRLQCKFRLDKSVILDKIDESGVNRKSLKKFFKLPDLENNDLLSRKIRNWVRNYLLIKGVSVDE